MAWETALKNNGEGGRCVVTTHIHCLEMLVVQLLLAQSTPTRLLLTHLMGMALQSQASL